MTCQQRANPAVVVPLAAEIDLTNNEQVYDQLYTAFFSGAPVVIADFTGTWFCDCSSLRRLLTVQQRAAARGGQLRLVIPPGSPVRRLADLVGLDGRLPIYSSTREASAWTLLFPALPLRETKIPYRTSGCVPRCDGNERVQALTTRGLA